MGEADQLVTIAVVLDDEIHNGFLAAYDNQIIIIDPYTYDNAFAGINLAVHNDLHLHGVWGEEGEFLVERVEVK